MSPIPDLHFLLVGSLACGAFLTWLTGRPGTKSAGLTVCYLLSLATIHLAGAWVSTLPTVGENAALVALGFRECFAGVAAFTAGVVFIEFLVINPGVASARRPAAPQVPPNMEAELSRNGRLFVVLGFVCAIGTHFAKGIPSVAALVHCGAYLAIAGWCLGCLVALNKGRVGQLLLWVGSTCVFPLFTLVTAGFLGYGVYAAMMVLCFLLVHYRPRWQAMLALAVLAYVGLSVYITYMRGRDELRGVVWHDGRYTERFQKVARLINSFEFFRPTEEQQLKAIDERLNQNYLVGAACAQLELGLVPWARGATIWRALAGVVPRILWPEKPASGGSGDIVSAYTGITFAEDTSVGVGQVMEFYINFGRWGVIAGFLCLGAVLRLVDWRAAQCLEQGQVSRFLVWYLPGLAFLQPGGCLVEVVGTAAASLVVALIASRIHASRRDA